jgi:hypothetical protein
MEKHPKFRIQWESHPPADPPEVVIESEIRLDMKDRSAEIENAKRGSPSVFSAGAAADRVLAKLSPAMIDWLARKQLRQMIVSTLAAELERNHEFVVVDAPHGGQPVVIVE